MTIYAVYNKQEECVCVGTTKECVKFMNRKSMNAFYYLVSTTKSGFNKGRNFKAYAIDDDDE